MPGTLTPEDHEELIASVDALLRQRAADSVSLEVAAKRADSVKTIVGVVLFFGSMFAGAVLTFQELKAKPTVEEVDHAIDEKIEPVQKKANHVEDIEEDVDEIRKDLDRVEEVQDYSIEQSAWQGDVLQHVAERKRTKPPPKPESLKAKERKLLRK
jgi:hypothetical protein